MKKLTELQNELKAPKNQRNNFGKYNYRSCEDILEAVKPLLLKHGLTLTVSDSVEECAIGSYVNATASVTDGKESATAQAQAGIEKAGGMALPQAFGSASSYARKYALNGLFLIDDTKDADSTNTHGKSTEAKPLKQAKPVAAVVPEMTPEQAIAAIDSAKTMKELQKAFTGLPAGVRSHPKVIAAKDTAKHDFENAE